MESVSREELIELLDTVFAVTDKMRRHADHYTYDGGTNEVDDLREALFIWAARVAYYSSGGM